MPTTPVLGLPYPVSTDTADPPRDIQALALAVEAQGVLPAGVIQMWPGVAAPAGWALTQGQTVDATANPKLAAIFGQAGGLVTLPDMQGRFPVGTGGGMALRTSGGANQFIMTGSEVGDHVHPMDSNVNVPSSPGAWSVDFAKKFGGSDPVALSVMVGGNSSINKTGTQTRPPNQAPHENRPAYLTLNFIIKLG